MQEEVPLVYEVADNSEFQVDDDPSLLELMVDDMKASRAFYHPTRYWRGYTIKIIELFLKVGLRDFRRSKERVLNSFGCLDANPQFEVINIVNDKTDATQNALSILNSAVDIRNILWDNGAPVGPGLLTVKNFFSMSERLADAKALEVGLKPISELSISRFGNPYGFIIDGSHRTFRSFYYFTINSNYTFMV